MEFELIEWQFSNIYNALYNNCKDDSLKLVAPYTCPKFLPQLVILVSFIMAQTWIPAVHQRNIKDISKLTSKWFQQSGWAGTYSEKWACLPPPIRLADCRLRKLRLASQTSGITRRSLNDHQIGCKFTRPRLLIREGVRSKWS